MQSPPPGFDGPNSFGNLLHGLISSAPDFLLKGIPSFRQFPIIPESAHEWGGSGVGLKIDCKTLICDLSAMKTLVEVIQDADQLSPEDQAGLAAHLLVGIRGCPLGPDDLELERRAAELDADSATLLTHQQL